MVTRASSWGGVKILVLKLPLYQKTDTPPTVRKLLHPFDQGLTCRYETRPKGNFRTLGA